MTEKKIIPVILCGGTGSRLWPLSRASFPKQYLKINPKVPISFFQGTVKRIKSINQIEKPIVICSEEHRFIVAEQLREIGVKNSDILLEPVGRNTAPAVTIACLKAIEKNKDSLVLILPADHIIEDEETFEKVLIKAKSYANMGKIVTFGITPNKAETGYGYIESKNDLDSKLLNGEAILRFIEKPDKEIAENFIKRKNFSWNSGIFLFKAAVMLKEIEINSKEIYNHSKKALSKKNHDLDFQRIDLEAFSKCKSISIDKEVMEKTKLGIVLPLNAKWSDVGSWQSLWEVGEKDNMENVISGNVVLDEVKNSYLWSDEKLIVAIGIKNIVIVQTRDALLVSAIDKTQKVKNIVQYLESNNKSEANKHKKIYRPWGNYTSIAEGKNWQVKKIIVEVGQSLSLQMHNYRTEHWIVVSGIALVEIDNEKKILEKNQSIYIPLGSKHRLSNNGKDHLILIEVQSGDYLGEDDIFRFADNYGRI